MTSEAERLWAGFIQLLNEQRPLGKHDDFIPHKSFIGPIDGYKKLFLEAARNMDKEESGIQHNISGAGEVPQTPD